MSHPEPDAIANIHRMAFGEEEGEQVAKLASDFLLLPETISICAYRDGKIVGNVLFTPFFFRDHPDAKCYLLAPLGVLPGYQQQGVGRELMEAGIERLKSIGADAVFVLGVPTFYPRYGFVPTDRETPYPDLLTMPEPWMVLELNHGTVASLGGKTSAIEAIMQPGFWDTSGRG